MLKRRIVLVFAFVCLVTLPPISALARTITVDDDGPADYMSVEQAVNAADGDTIFIKAGTYNECGIVLDGPALVRGEGADVTNIVGRMDQFLGKDWTGILGPREAWRRYAFVVWDNSHHGVPTEELTLGWEGEQKGVGFWLSSFYGTIRRCKLVENFVGIFINTRLSWPNHQIIQANTITGNRYGVVWDIREEEYASGLPGRADRNWWGTVVQSNIKAGFLDTRIQWWPELESWVGNEELFQLACYPWLEGPVDIERFVQTDEKGVHYNNIYDNEINLAQPWPLNQTVVSPTSWGEIKSRMR